MDDLETPAGGIKCGDGVALFAGERGNLVAAERGLAPGKDDAIGPGEIDDVAGGKFAAPDAGHADGEQAAALLTEDGHGVGIDQDGAGRALEIGEPALARLEREAARHEERAGTAAAEQLGE